MRPNIRVTRFLFLPISLILVAACGGGGSNSTPPPQPVAPTPPPPVMVSPDLTQNKLLTDSELRTTPMNPLPTVDTTYASWVGDNHYPVRSITFDQDYSDLDFLKGKIGDRALVQLGESSHGTREFNHIKTRMIKFLHQEMDFSVVAMESGFFDGIYADSQRETASEDSLMRFIFGVWQTNEVLELFRYVKETQTGPNPLRLIGFDTQISSSYYKYITDYINDIPTSADFTQTLKDDLKSGLAGYLSLQTEFSNQGCANASSSACQSAVNTMAALKQDLETFEASLESIPSPAQPLRVLSIAVFAAIGQIDNSTASYAQMDSQSIRDRNMATIIGRIRQDLYPDEKIVIWAHNRHVAHQESATVDASGQPFLLQGTMGFHLKKEIPDDLYTVGLYMLRGSTADNSRRSVPVVQPMSNSLEALAHSVRKAAIFIDTQPNQTQVDGNRFLFEPTYAHFWGGSFGSYLITPSDQFDGLLMIDQSSLPSYR